MAQEWDENTAGNSEPNQSQNILLLLNEKEQLKFLTLLKEADEHYQQYKESLEKLIEFFKDLQLEYEDLSEENREYLDIYDDISKFIENLESLVRNVSAPAEILYKALEK
ncbi:hypothetical protein [Sulfolobus monocaudavirus SMV4]|uniref:hypothetical protein n=1 Tax=Sulfolobus monocaudavirus SMV4 TaxID=1732178 RepID=UPI000705E614|nr:hypothetical protein AVT99_gp55 [Sulfolobus monocaudavirus SMV4]ALG97079.1 hypothetical protein [Sulfolobus monocaudavirus SMV4]